MAMGQTCWQEPIIRCLEFHDNCLYSIIINKDPQMVLKDSETIGTVPEN